MVAVINVSSHSFNFGDEGGPYTHLRKSDTVWIQNQLSGKDTLNKIKMLLDGISQLNSIKEPQSQRIIGIFKKDLYAIANVKENHEEIKVAINDKNYIYNDSLKDVLSHLEYKTNHLGLRCIHQTRKSLCAMHTMSKGAAYLLGGIALAGTGITISKVPGYEHMLWINGSLGLIFSLAPFCVAGYNACYGSSP